MLIEILAVCVWPVIILAVITEQTEWMRKGGAGHEKNRLQVVAIILTAGSAMPIFQPLRDIPILLMTVVVLGVGYIISAEHIGRSGVQTAVSLPVYGISTTLFGFFAAFQTWRILIKVIAWLDAIPIQFFNWIQI